MNPFRITMIVPTSDLVGLVQALNAKTHSAHIERETRVDDGRWLVSVAVTDREEAQFLRSLTPSQNNLLHDEPPTSIQIQNREC